MTISERTIFTATVFTRTDGICSRRMEKFRLEEVGREGCPGETRCSSSEVISKRVISTTAIFMSTI